MKENGSNASSLRYDVHDPRMGSLLIFLCGKAVHPPLMI